MTFGRLTSANWRRSRMKTAESYLLVVIKVLSKYVWIEPLRDKNTRNVAIALEKCEECVPITFQTDSGKEFIGSVLPNVFKKHHTKFHVARNPDVKVATVERLNRTNKERVWRYCTHRNTHKYIDVIQKIVHPCNNTLHSTIKMTPSEVNLYNAHDARLNLQFSTYWRDKKLVTPKCLKYNINDYVRIRHPKGTIAKGLKKITSRKIFIIVRILRMQGKFPGGFFV